MSSQTQPHVRSFKDMVIAQADMVIRNIAEDIRFTLQSPSLLTGLCFDRTQDKLCRLNKYVEFRHAYNSNHGDYNVEVLTEIATELTRLDNLPTNRENQTVKVVRGGSTSIPISEVPPPYVLSSDELEPFSLARARCLERDS